MKPKINFILRNSNTEHISLYLLNIFISIECLRMLIKWNLPVKKILIHSDYFYKQNFTFCIQNIFSLDIKIIHICWILQIKI